MRPRPVLLALALAAVGLASSAAHARQAPPPPRGAWLTLHTGFAFVDRVRVDGASIDSASGVAPIFGIGAHWRTSRMDLGGFIEHIGTGNYARLVSEAPIGGQIYAAVSFRWRYVERPWGGLYARLSPGLTIIRHSDTFRLDTADSIGQRLSAIEVRSFGFAFGVAVGLSVYITSRVAAFAELSLVNSIIRLRRSAEDLTYARVRGLVVVGVELRP